MAKKKVIYNIDDLVFVKVKGRAAWPAKIMKYQNKKYEVIFYGTGRKGYIKEEQIFLYMQYKKIFVTAKRMKCRAFRKSVKQIEATLKRRNKLKNSIRKAPAINNKAQLADYHPQELNNSIVERYDPPNFKVLERDLMQLSLEMQSPLILNRAKLDRCVQILEQFNGFKFHPITLLTHPMCIDSIRRLIGCIGNVYSSKMTTEENHEYNAKIEIIRSAAIEIFDTFIVLFGLQDASTIEKNSNKCRIII